MWGYIDILFTWSSVKMIFLSGDLGGVSSEENSVGVYGFLSTQYLYLFSVLISLKIFLCILSFSLRWPVRTVSFNHTGEFIAYASEDPFIDIVSG